MSILFVYKYTIKVRFDLIYVIKKVIKNPFGIFRNSSKLSVETRPEGGATLSKRYIEPT